MGVPTTIDLKNATITIQDGTTPTPNSIELKIGEGNFTWTERQEREYVLDRGTLDTVRDGDDTPCEVSFECRLQAITASSGDDPTPHEALKKLGAASAWASTGAACEPYAVDIIVDIDANCASFEVEQWTFSDFRWEEIGGDIDAGQLSVSGKCNVTAPVGVRS